MAITKMQISRLQEVAEEIMESIDDIDMINVKAFEDFTSPEAKELEAIYLTIRGQKENLDHFLDEQRKKLRVGEEV